MLEQIANWLVILVQNTGYVGIFLATVIESFFAPIPSEVILFTAGYAAKESGGIPVLLIICIVAALGNFVGTLPFYVISRFGAETVLPRLIRRFGPFLLISESDLHRAEKLFAKHGKALVFFARLVPAIRSLIAFPAGLSKMNFVQYTVFTLLGSFTWDLFLGGIGFAAYEAKDQIFALLAPVEKFVLLVICVLVIAYVVRVIYQIRKLRIQSAS